MTDELTEHRGDLRDGRASCSCGWKSKDDLKPATDAGDGLDDEAQALIVRNAIAEYVAHLNIPWFMPRDNEAQWEINLRVGHMFTVGAHERAYGATLGELKTPPSKGRTRTMLQTMRRDGMLTSQQPPYSDEAPVAP